MNGIKQIENLSEKVVVKTGGKLRIAVYETEDFRETEITMLDLGTRSLNGLRRNGVHTIGDLIDKYSQLEQFRNMGKKCRQEIAVVLAQYQYSLFKTEERKEEYLNRLLELNA